MPPERGFLRGEKPADNPNQPDLWREGKHLPHWDGTRIPQSITFRLHDSVPEHVIQKWRRELKHESDANHQKELIWKIQKYMDRGYGNCWLEQTEIADLVQDTLLHFDEERYVLHAWVIMPNHVHVLMTIIESYDLSSILHSWRSYSAQRANEMLNRNGTFWADDYYDRYIRDGEHFGNVVRYIEMNPVRAGLCQRPEDWVWNSSYFKSKGVF